MQSGSCKSSLPSFQRVLSNEDRHVYPICALSFHRGTEQTRGYMAPGWSLALAGEIKKSV